MSAQQLKAILKYPVVPKLPAHSPHSAPPNSWGAWGFQTAEEALPSGIAMAPAPYPSSVLMGMPGDHCPWRRIRRGQDRSETLDSGRHMDPHAACSGARWERLLCSSCNCVAERLPLPVFICQRGNCVGAGMGAGWKGRPILYQRCYISVMGWGGEGITGAMEVEMPPTPQASKCSFLFKVFFYSLFSSLVDGDSCEFSEGAI